MRRSARGFTFIELLVVISILAIISSLAMVFYGSVQKKIRDNTRISDLNNFKLVLHLYRRDKGTFIPWSSSSDGTSGLTIWQAYVTDPTLGVNGSATNSLKNVFLPKYFGKIPTDPKFNTSGDDYYLKITPGSFILSAKLETPPTGTLSCTPEGAQRNYCITE